MIVTGCDKNSRKSNNEYYVKYEVNSSTIYYGKTLVVNVKSNNNQSSTLEIAARKPWEFVIGPVNRGFKAELVVNENGTNYGHLSLFAKISVSKDGSAFSVKSFDDNRSERTTVTLNYTIDY
ncbi:MAG: hypothetical protein EOO43_12400 [Flavobacterium sp.]|nr:MAG: hypothetical protein EOO43_12400 [Flavobacterium sp.]